MKSGNLEIWRQGLWDNNPGLVQLLGLCPLLAVTGTAVNGLGLGLATLFVLVISNLAVSAMRGVIRPEIRIPVFVLVIATLVTVVDLVMQAWFSSLSQTLGIFIPLIVTNCTILGRAEAFASRRPIGDALVDGLAQGTGFAAVLIVLGAGRELIGHGTLMADAHLLLGDWAHTLEITFLPQQTGLLLAVLPPGAFIGLGLMVAARNRIIRSRAERTEAAAQTRPQAA
ncbi:MAG TPA: electron transport complex subunit E [Wenzhouxiangellaceae bacterium]|nr:electron transport complex subunit E [Wenzhouxiangellaceae bacterium]